MQKFEFIIKLSNAFAVLYGKKMCDENERGSATFINNTILKFVND